VSEKPPPQQPQQEGRPLQIRFQAATERAQLDALAARANLPTSTYARTVLLGVNPPRQARRPTVQHQEAARCLGAWGHVASTLRKRVPELAADLEPDLQAVGNLIKQLLG
jgi:hypothetical protein